MNPLYNVNGLMFWTAKEIRLRENLSRYFSEEISAELLKINPQWQIHQVESPLLTPRDLLNPNYTDFDIWAQEDPDGEGFALALRPETTPGSYVYAQHLLNSHSGTKPPFVVWQSGKSFRREQDSVTKNVRLKEFYQQEFQCIYAADTANDYHAAILEPVRKMIADQLSLPTRLATSDRLPSYSEITTDVEVFNGDKWMEVCSISRRTDFTEKARFTGKGGTVVEKDLLVLEVAIGLDRCVYNWAKARDPELKNVIWS
jgi:glycyl-tRNA synthetase